METACSYTDDWAWFSSDERKWVTKIRKLAEQYPDKVIIKRQPEDNDGCIYAKVPASWLKIQPKYTRNYSDEQRAIYAEMARKLVQERRQVADK